MAACILLAIAMLYIRNNNLAIIVMTQSSAVASFYGTRRPHQSSQIQYAYPSREEWIPAEDNLDDANINEVDDNDDDMVQDVTLGNDMYGNQAGELFRQNYRPGTDPLCLKLVQTLIISYCYRSLGKYQAISLKRIFWSSEINRLH